MSSFDTEGRAPTVTAEGRAPTRRKNSAFIMCWLKLDHNPNIEFSVEIVHIAFGYFQSEEWLVKMIELHVEWSLANGNVQTVQ
jgi:hypothetical protein